MKNFKMAAIFRGTCLLAILLLNLSGCAQGDPSTGKNAGFEGRSAIGITLPAVSDNTRSALGKGESHSVLLTVTDASGMPLAIDQVDDVSPGDKVIMTVDVPPGPDRTFTAEIFDAKGKVNLMGCDTVDLQENSPILIQVAIDPPIIISPERRMLPSNKNQTFTASLNDCLIEGSEITWHVDDIENGNSVIGTIVPTGAETANYQAPALVPSSCQSLIKGTVAAQAGRYFDEAQMLLSHCEDAKLTWAIQAPGAEGTQGFDEGIAIASFLDGHFVVTGRFEDKTTFGKGEINETTFTSNGASDIFVARYQSDGNLDWVKQAGGTNSDSGASISTHPDGSSVITGYFTGTATFGSGEVNETSLTSDGVQDVFVARYDPEGMLSWAVQAGGAGNDQGHSVTALADGSVAVAGHFSENAYFGQEDIIISAGSSDIFIARYLADGSLAWVSRAGGINGDHAQAVTKASDDALFLSGNFRDFSIFGEKTDPNSPTLRSQGSSDIFIARYDLDGNLVWVRQAGGEASDSSNAIAPSLDSGVFVTGQFQNIAFFGAENNTSSLTAAFESDDLFLAYYDSDGNFIWVNQVEGPGQDHGETIALLADGSVVLAGHFEETTTFAKGEVGLELTLTASGIADLPRLNEAFIACYNSDGKFAWAKQAGGNGSDKILGLTTFNDGSIVTTGHFAEIATFGVGESDPIIFQAAGQRDFFIARYDPFSP